MFELVVNFVNIVLHHDFLGAVDFYGFMVHEDSPIWAPAYALNSVLFGCDRPCY